MKLLLVADLHYTLKQLDWLHRQAGHFDLVVIAGDLLDIVSMVPIEAQIVVVQKYLQQIAPQVPLLVASGNHDLDTNNADGEAVASWLQDERRQGRLWVDGDTWEHGGFFFTLCPWWDGPASRDAVGEQLERDAARAEGKRWIWVYHAPPDASPISWNGKEDFGDAILRGWIERYAPEMVLGGHIHHAPFAKDGSWIDNVAGSWVFNGGRQIGPTPTFTVIDTDEHTATWLSLAGAEQAQLAVLPPQPRPLVAG